VNLTASSTEIIYKNNDVQCKFDRQTGQLISITNKHMSMAYDGLTIDVGCDGEYIGGSLAFHSFDPLNTWSLPPIDPLPNAKGLEFLGYNENLQELQMIYAAAGLEVTVKYTLRHGAVEVTTRIKNVKGGKRIINGVAFLLKQQAAAGDVSFTFPGNIPYQEFLASELQVYDPVVTNLVNPIIQCAADNGQFNVLFVDEEEKWGTGVYKTQEGAIHYANVAGVESFLDINESLTCGTLYIQLNGSMDPYMPIRDLYRRKGWNPPSGGHTDGVLYSCHPHGTMDSNFQDRKTLREYAEEFKDLKEMGIDHVWILPIFEHLDRGVYHPTDQRIVDERYGGDEAVRYFSKTLHDLGMTLLFDYVPHGPEPEDPLGQEHMEWASLDRDGNPKLEWKCLSFDMTNPEYRQYTTELVEEHIDRFDVDGSRIDCAMGGLSNWNPLRGNRPSHSSLRGGVCISKAIRDGFVNKNKKPIVTPENFNPVPVYIPHTDIFYDMPFYRALWEMDMADLTPLEYTRNITRWLHDEMMTTPENYIKLRFLGNHDTVSWVLQKARATEVYGAEKAKALWVLMACIDGVPMIYQGDEEASIYRKEGPNLRGFFKDLFAARKQWLGNQYDVQYLYTGTPVMAFLRTHGDEKRLVVINLSPDTEKWTVDYNWDETLFGQNQSTAGEIELSGFGYSILKIN
jgi:glycosidase